MLLNSYQIPQRAKLSITDAAHDNQMFGAAKRTVLFAMFDYPVGESSADPGKLLEDLGGSGIDVDAFCRLTRTHCVGKTRLLIVRLCLVCLR